MEFMRPLALWKKRDEMTTQQNHESVSRSVTQSVTQPASHPSPPEHCDHRQKQHPQSSIIRANHASTWLVVYVHPPCSRKACTKSSSPSSPSYISLHHTARTDQQQEQHKPKRITTTTNQTQPRSTRASSSKWQSQRKGGAPNHSHIKTYRILMPEKSAIESMMP